MPNAPALLRDLLHERDLDRAVEIVKELEDSCGYSWLPVGRRENNYGQINIGSDPGYALVERITNAIDAVIEREAALDPRTRSGSAAPVNPREAVQRWFAVEAGRIRNLENDQRQSLADNVVVTLTSGKSGRAYPTIAIRDLGIGLTPEMFPGSILGLGESNKIDKAYLAGAYGQGGSTTFAFSPQGTLIASRRQANLLNGAPDCIALTFVRFQDLDPRVNKNGRYEFMVTPEQTVPSIAAEAVNPSVFAPGTLVVHFDYDLPKYSAALTQLTGSLWWLLQNALFDPVLPIWAVDNRTEVTKKDRAERRSITGNHTRLWADRRSKVEHTDSIQVNLPHPEGDSRVMAHYWVAALPEDATRNARPIEVYVDPHRPVTHTYFGQTHGFEDRRFVRDRLQLPYLDRFLIVQIELDQLSPYARRQILSTTRDRLKESALYDDLRERLAHALAEDSVLVALNEERKSALLSSYSESERQKMRERFARLLTALSAGRDANMPSKGEGEGGRESSGSRQREPLLPLPTADAPSFVRIANIQRPILIRLDRAAVIRLESDAPDGYLVDHDPNARIVLSSDPGGRVLMESRSDFRGGRSRVLVRPGSDVKAGEAGHLDVFLLTPTGESFRDRVAFRVIDHDDRSTTGDDRKGKVKAPEPVPISREKWPDLGWNAASVAQVDVDGAGVRILVNMDNQHIVRLLETGGYQEKGLQRMKNNFLLYTAYYAWLQHSAPAASHGSLLGEDFDNYQQQELDRAAQTVVSAIAAEGRLE